MALLWGLFLSCDIRITEPPIFESCLSPYNPTLALLVFRVSAAVAVSTYAIWARCSQSDPSFTASSYSGTRLSSTWIGCLYN